MPQTLDEATVRHVAHLARLTISDEEVAQLARQLSEILDFINQLNELDTTQISPTAHAIAVSNIFREDEVKKSLPLKTVLSNAPGRHETFFKVPKVLDRDTGA